LSPTLGVDPSHLQGMRDLVFPLLSNTCCCVFVNIAIITSLISL